MKLMTNKKLTALPTDNARKMFVMLIIVLAYTVFTCRSYEYQILLSKTFIIGFVFVDTIEQSLHGDITDGVY